MKIRGLYLLNRMMKYLLAVCLVVFIVADLVAQPATIHLSLSESTDNKNHSGINFTWSNVQDDDRQHVVYGTTRKMRKKAKSTKAMFNGRYVYRSSVQKLAPDTRYYYKVGSKTHGWSEVFSFTTPSKTGAREPFTVGVFGDTQNDGLNETFEKTKTMVPLIAAHKPSFVLHMGDLVNNGSIDNDWLTLLKVAQPLIAEAPMMLTLGNHDIENAKGEHFQQPFPSYPMLFAMPGDGLDYSFRYGNARFVCLFSGLAKSAADQNLLRYGLGSPERAWLEQTLATARNEPGTDWIIVYTHYPLHSYGASNVEAWKEQITPLLEAYGVDLCLSGHRHVYERHHSLKNGQPSLSGEGTVYITNGSAGGTPQGVGGHNIPTMAFTPTEKLYTYATLTISGRRLHYEVFNENDVKIDEFEKVK